jgi:antitoxin ParD1/3/4
VATAYDAVVADPSRAVTAQTVRARLAAEQAGSV